MKISPINNNYNTCFKAAVVNINAFSDTHGELKLANNALESMRRRNDDLFFKEEKGRKNVVAICGDWFMDGGRTGYVTNPNRENAMFQLDMLNSLLGEFKKLAKGSITTLFTPGNHEFDGGVELLNRVLSKVDADVLMTNLDLDNSTAFKENIYENKIINEKIIEVEDDKDDSRKHKLLFLGISPVNMVAYQKNMEGVSLIDNVDKPQKYVKKEDYKKTLEHCKKRIREFKEANPQGIVILLSHTGVEFADTLALESNVDLIFDGHEHKDEHRYVNGTPIIPLSQNFRKIVNAKIIIGDDGEINNYRFKSFSPLANKEKGPLLGLYNRLFKQDIKKTYSIRTKNPSVSCLDVRDIRIGNNYLANFVTDSVLEEIKKKDPTVNFFAINSSAIRHPLKVSAQNGVTPFDVMNVLSGIKEEEGQIMTTEISGRGLSYLVADNYAFNRKDPNSNPIIHYAGLVIDKSALLRDLDKGVSPRDLTKHIIDMETKQPIVPDKKYKIANVEKYFNKSLNPLIKKLKVKSKFLDCCVQDLFKEHFEKSDGILHAKCDKRII